MQMNISQNEFRIEEKKKSKIKVHYFHSKYKKFEAN